MNASADRLQQISPVVRENVRSGAVSRYVHAYRPALHGTLCGMDERPSSNPAVQLSVEPEGTEITCPRCLAAIAAEEGSSRC